MSSLGSPMWLSILCTRIASVTKETMRVASVVGCIAAAARHRADVGSGSIPDLSTGSLTVSQSGQTGRWQGGRILEVHDEIPLESNISQNDQ